METAALMLGTDKSRGLLSGDDLRGLSGGGEPRKLDQLLAGADEVTGSATRGHWRSLGATDVALIDDAVDALAAGDAAALFGAVQRSPTQATTRAGSPPICSNASAT